MTTSSADPGALGHYSSTLAARAADLAEALAAATRALSAYASACPEVPVDQSLALTAPGRVQRARSLAHDVRVMMEAFANADRGSGPPGLSTVTVSDLALSLHLARTAPGLATGALLEPIRARSAQGAEVGRRLSELAGGLTVESPAHSERAIVLLEELDAPDLGDPAFAAGLLNCLDARAVESLTTAVLRHRHSTADELPTALQNLQILLRTAGRTRSGPFQGGPLTATVISDLTSHASGRQTLRLLLWGGRSSTPTPPELIGLVQEDLLVASSASLDSRGAGDEVSRFLLRHRIDIDSMALRSISGHPTPVGALLADPAGISRIRANLHPSSFPALATVVAVQLGHLTTAAERRLSDHHRGQVSTGASGATERADEAIRSYVATLAARPTTATTEELVLAADAMGFDLGYYLDPGPGARSGGAGPREEIDALMPAFAEDRAALVFLLATIDDWEREVLDRHFAGVDPRLTLTEVAHIDHFQRRLHDAAVAADVPDDDWAFAVSVARGLVDHSASAAAVKTKGASLLAGPAAHRGLDRVHEALKGDPGDHAELGEAQQARRRINAWCALARSPHGSGLRWGDLGEVQIRDLAELASLDPDEPADHQRLARWALSQDEDLRRRVDEVAEP